jgi:hypothetical protein
MASDPAHAAIRTTQDAIKAAQRLLDEAQAHYLLRLYRPEDGRLAHELHKCLTLGRVALALGLELEREAARGGGRHERLRQTGISPRAAERTRCGPPLKRRYP